jgi:hypothetical protein
MRPSVNPRGGVSRTTPVAGLAHLAAGLRALRRSNRLVSLPSNGHPTYRLLPTILRAAHHKRGTYVGPERTPLHAATLSNFRTRLLDAGLHHARLVRTVALAKGKPVMPSLVARRRDVARLGDDDRARCPQPLAPALRQPAEFGQRRVCLSARRSASSSSTPIASSAARCASVGTTPRSSHASSTAACRPSALPLARLVAIALAELLDAEGPLLGAARSARSVGGPRA